MAEEIYHECSVILEIFFSVSGRHRSRDGGFRPRSYDGWYGGGYYKDYGGGE
jgi:hypothetical protein